MLTWKLWRALNRPPPPSPLYRRMYIRQMAAANHPLFVIRIPLFGLVKDISLIIFPILMILLGAPILVLLYYLALLLAPLLLPLVNTIYGVMHANSASASIARERDRQTYDVLCTSPAGILGMHWTYSIGWLHYHWLLRYALMGVLSIGIVASLFGLSGKMVFGGGEPSSFFVTLIRAGALGLLFVIDYLQTPVLSSLTSLLVPTYSENESNTRLWASSLFLGLQVAVYLPTLLIGVYALPITIRLLGINPLLGDALIPLGVLAFFVALRETIIIGLWNRVKQELSATSVELDAITRLAV